MFIHQSRDRRPFRRAMATCGLSVLLLQLVAAAQAACASMHPSSADGSHERTDVVHGDAHTSGSLAVSPMGPGGEDHSSEPNCSMTNNCATGVRSLSPAIVSQLAQPIVGVYGPSWQPHLAPTANLVPPPKI